MTQVLEQQTEEQKTIQTFKAQMQMAKDYGFLDRWLTNIKKECPNAWKLAEKEGLV